MNREAKQALIVALFTLSKVLRMPPNLAEEGPDGGSLVVTVWETALDEAMPTVTAEEIEMAFRTALTASAFFPAPAELIEHARARRRERRALIAPTEAKALPEERTAMPAEAREAMLKIAARFGVAPPLTPTPPQPTPEERERLRGRQQAELTRLDEWKRAKGLA